MAQNEPQNEDSQGILVFGVTVEMQGDRSGTTGSYWGPRGGKDTAGALLRRGGVARAAQFSQWVGAWGPRSYVLCGGAPGWTSSKSDPESDSSWKGAAHCLHARPQPCSPASEGHPAHSAALSKGWPPPFPRISLPTPPGDPCSRHHDDAEVQPVPGIPEECEVIDAEASGQDLDEGLEGVDPCEGVPGRERAGQGQACHTWARMWVAEAGLLGGRARGAEDIVESGDVCHSGDLGR